MTLLAASIFVSCMIAAALCDLLRMTIPNRLQVVLAGGFLFCALLSGWSYQTIGIHAAVGMLALLLTFGCFAAGWMGGGDAKLIAATALWLGPTPLLMNYLFDAALFGGILTLGLLGTRALVAPTTGVAFLDRLLGRETGVPYALALAPAGLLAFASGPWANAAGPFSG